METVREKDGSYTELYLFDANDNEVDNTDDASYGYLKEFDKSGNFIMEHVLKYG